MDINAETNLTKEELKNELFSYAENKILPEKIIENIYCKLIEKDISINREQLSNLMQKFVEKNSNINISNVDVIKNSSKLSSNENIPKGKNIEVDNILLKKLNNIENRITNLEESILSNTELKSNINKIYSTDEKQNLKTNLNIVKLTEIPMDAESIVILMKWLQYLVNQIGKNKVSEALDFYVDVGWISEDIKFDLLKYIKCLTDVENIQEQEGNERKITSKEHINSLLFLQKLKGMNMDDFLWKIDQDLDKFFKSINSYNIIK